MMYGCARNMLYYDVAKRTRIDREKITEVTGDHIDDRVFRLTTPCLAPKGPIIPLVLAHRLRKKTIQVGS